ncbi:plasma protease C1 inhibitor [Garra rufa]|uniref:plasma protease C1 inhibitor n=1 Tax=Garra rufa TaxID=137080 RepID=UPI003CCE5B6E
MHRVLLLLCAGLSLSTCAITVLLNSGISLTCLPDDVPKLIDSTYIWSFTSAHTQERQTLEEKGDILNLRNIITSQEGQYTCVQKGYIGEDRFKLSRTFTIRVEAPPPFHQWQVVKIVAGSDAMLQCKVPEVFSSGETEKPPVVWKRETNNGVVLLETVMNSEDQKEEDKTHQRVFWDISPEEHDWAIKISQTKEDDAGMYHCVITNTSQMLSVELEVEAPPLPRCFGYTDPWEDCKEQDSRSGKATLAESLTEFSSSVYADLKGSKPETNLIFSPVSIAVALYNLLLGARGETRKQLEGALRLPSEFSCVHFETKNLRKAIKDTLEMASAIFYSPEQELGEAFVNQSLQFYDAKPQKLTNDSNQNVNLIKEWVAKKTKNKIPELTVDVDEMTSFVLLNAVYFNGKWKTDFESTNKHEPFRMFSGELIDVPILYSSKYNLQLGYNKKLQAEVSVTINAHRSFSGNGAI